MDPVKSFCDNFAARMNLTSSGCPSYTSSVVASNANTDTSSNNNSNNVLFNSRVSASGAASNTAAAAAAATSNKSTFSWKLDAPEFVPRSAAAASSTTLSVAGDFVASSSTVAAVYDPNDLDSAANVDYATILEHILNDVDYYLAQLQNDPENLESISAELLEYVYANVFDQTALSTVMTRLLDAALRIPNFAYICVRLIVWLHDNFDSKSCQIPDCQPSTCRCCLVNALQAEFDARKSALEDEIKRQKSAAAAARNGGDSSAAAAAAGDNGGGGGGSSSASSSAATATATTGDDPSQTQRLFIFVNALCMFSTLMSYQGKPFRVLVNAIYEILTKIVERRTDSYVRFGIQTLKTVGAHLESTEKLEAKPNETDLTPLMDKLIDLLECIGTEPDSLLSDNTKFMIRNLRGVRRHWAYVAPPPPSPIQQQLPPVTPNASGENSYYDLEQQQQQSSQYLAPNSTGGVMSHNNSAADLSMGGLLDVSNSSIPPPSSYLAYLDDPYAGGADMSAAALYFPPPNFADDYAAAAAAAAAATASGGGHQNNNHPFQQQQQHAQQQQQMGASGDGSSSSLPPGQQQALPPHMVTSTSTALYFTPASLTPAEAAFFERVCSEGAAGDVGLGTNSSTDDDTIADAYEEFLRNINQARR